MDVEMEAEVAAAPPEAKVKQEPQDRGVTRQRAVGGGRLPMSDQSTQAQLLASSNLHHHHFWHM